jgi:hypothetical protein
MKLTDWRWSTGGARMAWKLLIRLIDQKNPFSLNLSYGFNTDG